MNIFVANLNLNTTEEALLTLFENYGKVETVRIAKDKMKKTSKGYGFVEMPDREEGVLAIEVLNEFNFEGNDIKVRESDEDTKPQNNKRRPYNKNARTDNKLRGDYRKRENFKK